MSIYIKLTEEFNAGRLRAIISSGQAVVLHRLAMQSKDGDWILREEEEDFRFVLQVLERHGAVYRFGAPLDVRWLRGGWSAHLEFQLDRIRVRTDFFSRPPRLDLVKLQEMWSSYLGLTPPFLAAPELALVKRTRRQKDFAVIGELARIMPEVRDQILHSRSARDLEKLAADHPLLIQELSEQRPLLKSVVNGREALERAIFEEYIQFVRQDEARLEKYRLAAEPLRGAWPKLSKSLAELPLSEAHQLFVDEALSLLPFSV